MPALKLWDDKMASEWAMRTNAASANPSIFYDSAEVVRRNDMAQSMAENTRYRNSPQGRSAGRYEQRMAVEDARGDLMARLENSQATTKITADASVRGQEAQANAQRYQADQERRTAETTGRFKLMGDALQSQMEANRPTFSPTGRAYAQGGQVREIPGLRQAPTVTLDPVSNGYIFTDENGNAELKLPSSRRSGLIDDDPPTVGGGMFGVDGTNGTNRPPVVSGAEAAQVKGPGQAAKDNRQVVYTKTKVLANGRRIEVDETGQWIRDL